MTRGDATCQEMLEVRRDHPLPLFTTMGVQICRDATLDAGRGAG
jgi:hypothetical protein